LYFSAGERGAEFVNPQDITRDNGKFTASMRMEEFLQTILCRCKTGERSHLFLAPQSTRISTQLQELFGIKSTERRRRNQHHKKGANYGWPVVTYGIDYDGTTISDKTKSQELKTPSTIGFLLSLPAE
jgi:hypothetical protein